MLNLGEQKVLLVGPDTKFLSKVQTSLIFDDAMIDADICTQDDMSGLLNVISETNPDTIVIYAPLVKSFDLSNISCNIYTYAHDTKEYDIIAELPYETYGICGVNSTLLAQRIINNEHAKPVTQTPEPAAQAPVTQAQEPIAQTQKPVAQAPVTQTQNPVTQINDTIPQTEEPETQVYSPVVAEPKPTEEINDEIPMEQYAFHDVAIPDLPSPFKTSPRWESNEKPYHQSTSTTQPTQSYSASANPAKETKPVQAEATSSSAYQNYQEQAKQRTEPETPKKSPSFRYFSSVQDKQREIMQQRENADANPSQQVKKKPATVITFTSGKGGVGKTTLSIELATMLATTQRVQYNDSEPIEKNSKKPDTYSVCIIDMNIEFGNISSAFTIEDGISMNMWAADIQERKARNYPCTYTEDEIRYYLQQPENYEGFENLYILCAPFYNEDSARLKLEEIDCILDNVIKNGGFDYVIIDTNNSTNDTVLYSIQKSDYVFIIVTSDANAVEADKEFYLTFDHVHKVCDIDMSKFYMVFNKAKSKKASGLTPEDVISYIKSEIGCDTIATISYTDDVGKAMNYGTPYILSDPNSKFAREVGDIASFINEDISPVPEEEKRGFFHFFSFLKR